MKDISFFFFLKSSKMRKGFRNSCNGHTSTSTLDQNKVPPPPLSISSSATLSNTNYNQVDPPRKSVTLEEMILQLELEEAATRRAEEGQGRDQQQQQQQRRMSCVNNNDILRSARNALNQYPRFSLDGKDAMYRASFRNSLQQANSYNKGFDLGGLLKLPQSVGGENVVWCKPGVVAKLMGLDAMPVPTRSWARAANKHIINNNNNNREDFIRSRRLRRRAERHELERRMHYMNQKGWY